MPINLETVYEVYTMAKRDLPEINLPSNNIQEPNTPKGVVQVTTKPKRRSSRFANEVRGISSYLYSDVILPALKGIISDFVTNGIDMILHGDQQTTDESVVLVDMAPDHQSVSMKAL